MKLFICYAYSFSLIPRRLTRKDATCRPIFQWLWFGIQF